MKARVDIREAQKDETENRKRRTYSGAYKARVVLELFSGTKTLQELAEEHELHPNQIKNWKSRFLRNAPSLLEDNRRAGTRKWSSARA